MKRESKMRTTGDRLIFIHVLRGFAAFLVVFWHIGGMFWRNQPACSTLGFFPENTGFDFPVWANILEKLNHIQIDIGMIGVSLFFLISGFLIPNSLKKYTPIEFLKKRVMRLYPVYAVALTLTCAVLFVSAKYYGISMNGMLNGSLYFKNLSLFRDFFWVRSIDGTNWTMEYEVKFYLICAYIAWMSSLDNEKTLLNMIGGGTVFNYILHNIVRYIMQIDMGLYKFLYTVMLSVPFITLMFIGTSISNYYRKIWSGQKTIKIVLFLGILMFANLYWLQPERIIAYLVNYSIGGLIFVISYMNQSKFKEIKLVMHWADISFPVYLIHGAAGYAIMNYLYRATMSPIIATIVTIMIVIIFAEMIHYGIERPLNFQAKKC